MGRAFVFVAVLGLMPEACAKILGQPSGPAPQTEPVPVIPSTPAVPPPTFAQPDFGPAPAPAPPPTTSPELVKAREANQKNDFKKVRTLLMPKVKGGKANREEAQLLGEACLALRDKPCVDLVRKTHPEVDVQ